MESLMSVRYLVLLGADQFLRERMIVAALRNFNCKVIAIVKNNVYLKNRFLDDLLQADPTNSEECIQALQSFMLSKPGSIIGIVPCNDWTLLAATNISNFFKLPSLSLDTVIKSRDKFKMKNAFLQSDLLIPRIFEFKNFDELNFLTKKLNYPVVIKPKDFGGSGGVIKVNSEEELFSAFKHCSEILNQYFEIFNISKEEYVVEEYISAKDEISVEIFVQNNEKHVIAVTDKYLGEEPWFAEIGHVVPSIYTNSNLVKDIAIKAVDALGIDKGMCHVEMRITPNNNVYLMEVGARPGGDGIMDLVERVYNINPYYLHIAAWLGEKVNFDNIKLTEPQGSAAIAFLKAPVGKILKINPLNNYPKEMLSLYVNAKIGDISENATCWRSREGIAEFYWNKKFDRKITDHLELANKISNEIFEVEKL